MDILIVPPTLGHRQDFISADERMTLLLIQSQDSGCRDQWVASRRGWLSCQPPDETRPWLYKNWGVTSPKKGTVRQSTRKVGTPYLVSWNMINPGWTSSDWWFPTSWLDLHGLLDAMWRCVAAEAYEDPREPRFRESQPGKRLSTRVPVREQLRNLST